MSYTFPNIINSNADDPGMIHSGAIESKEGELCFPIPNTTKLHVQIHERAVKISTRYKNDEIELIEVLDQVENHKVYLHYKCKSLFQYGVKKLNLSENVVYSLIGIMRKSREVPELKLELQQGNLNLSNARRIVPLLTPENKNEWIEKASELTQAKLEKEIVKVRPRDATPERARYINQNRIKLELGLFEKDMMKLRRVQDLVCQSKGESANLEDTLIAMMDFYLQCKDPVMKAKRVCVKKGFSQCESQKDKFKKDARAQGENSAQNLKKDEMFSTEPRTHVPLALEAGAMNIAPTKKVIPDKKLETPVEEMETHAEAFVSIPNELVLIPKTKKSAAAVIFSKAQCETQHKPQHKTTTQAALPKRTPIPTAILHQVNLRDKRKCTYPDTEKKPCNQTRWTQIHHRTPVSQGGKNTLANLTTLCSTHHRWVHDGISREKHSKISMK